MMHPDGFRRRLTLALLTYVVVVTFVVAVHGYVVNERAEFLVWTALLKTELAHFSERHSADPAYRWTDTETLSLYGHLSDRPMPPQFAALPAGVHDDVKTPDGEFVVLVSDTDEGRDSIALEISDIERSEHRLGLAMAGSTAAVIAVLVLVAHFGVGWLIRPLSSMARAISSLVPERAAQRLTLDPSAPREVKVIADALNGYLDRLDQFIERERAFVNMASHELRTPIAVIAGAAEVALDRHAAAPAAESYAGILATARDMERLVALLVALAKDPARLRAADESVELSALIPSIVADHEFLAKHKELAFDLDVRGACAIRAPTQIARAAIGNLLRNAIENSDRGVIRIVSSSDAKVTITDPGHGMSAAEVSAVYTRLSRSGEMRGAGGIGIELISRLCEHLGWRLAFSSEPHRGTSATLDFGTRS